MILSIVSINCKIQSHGIILDSLLFCNVLHDFILRDQ